MKILFTGGGTGGHFYPIIAVAQEIKKLAEEGKLVQPKRFFMSTGPYNSRILSDYRIQFLPVQAGKVRRYFSLLNFLDAFKTLGGLIQALFKICFLGPDVVFSKGGYAGFPAVFAARLLRIPVFVHESDSHPGRVNFWASRFVLPQLEMERPVFRLILTDWRQGDETRTQEFYGTGEGGDSAAAFAGQGAGVASV